MKTVCISIIGLLFASAIVAQADADKQKDEINKIKINKNYIYGEATLPDRAEALQLAKELLIKNINDWIAGEKKMSKAEAVVIRDIVEHGETINLMRGNMFRAFVYVQKKSILPIEDTDHAVVISRSTSNREEPAIAVNEIQKIEPKETTNEGIAESSGSNENDAMPDILKSIVAITKFSDVAPLFQQLKVDRKIIYGGMNTLTSPENCYLLIYNKEGEVVAVLDKGHRKNLRTQKEDSTKNYSGCGAIWFQLL